MDPAILEERNKRARQCGFCGKAESELARNEKHQQCGGCHSELFRACIMDIRCVGREELTVALIFCDGGSAALLCTYAYLSNLAT
jgi:hypothetical protein